MINVLNTQLELTDCYTPLITKLVQHLTDTELQSCIINNKIDADEVINFFTMIPYASGCHLHNKCTCGVSISNVFFIRKINTDIILPIGCVCIKKCDKFRDEYKELDRKYWNPDKYCKHCGKGGLRGWRRGKVHRKCYKEYCMEKKLKNTTHNKNTTQMSNSTPNSTPNKRIVLKYLRETKYDRYMFQVIHLPSSDECYFKIKDFQNRKYVYLPKKRVKTNTALQKDCYYNVYVKTWLVTHLAAVMKHYTLSITEKPVEQCTINIDSDSEVE